MSQQGTDTISVFGVRIRMTQERWQHVVREHPELEGLSKEVLATVGNPEKVLAGNYGELLALKEIIPGKYLVVAYKEIDVDDGFVITAFLSKRIRQLDKRVVIWPKQ